MKHQTNRIWLLTAGAARADPQTNAVRAAPGGASAGHKHVRDPRSAFSGRVMERRPEQRRAAYGAHAEPIVPCPKTTPRS